MSDLISREINRIPIAYGTDKIIEELEKNASRYTKKYLTPYGNNGYRDTKAISVHKAIEIVKAWQCVRSRAEVKGNGSK